MSSRPRTINKRQKKKEKKKTIAVLYSKPNSSTTGVNIKVFEFWRNSYVANHLILEFKFNIIDAHHLKIQAYLQNVYIETIA